MIEERRRLRDARAPTAQPAPVLLGGSNIAVSAKSANQDLAKEAVALMLSDEYQTILAENGLTPAQNSLAPLLGDDEFAAATIEAASNAKLTPAAPAGPASRVPASWRTCSSPSRRAVTPAELAADADERSAEQLN